MEELKTHFNLCEADVCYDFLKAAFERRDIGNCLLYSYVDGDFDKWKKNNFDNISALENGNRRFSLESVKTHAWYAVQYAFKLHRESSTVTKRDIDAHVESEIY